MQAQLEEMSKQMAKEKKKVNTPVTTPSPKPNTTPSPASSRASVAAAKPKSTKKPPASAATQDPSDSESDSAEGASGEEGEPALSVGARNNRLRRICEMKPSLKLKVPQRIHDQWKKGGHAREELMEQLEAANWDKDHFFHEFKVQRMLNDTFGWSS